MLKTLTVILEIQEYDMKMIRLMRLKKERQKELDQLNAIKTDLKRQCMIKDGEILELKKNIRVGEGDVEEIKATLKKLEAQQNAVKKLDEFNALTHETSAVERERHGKELRLSDLYDKLNGEEEIFKKLTETFNATEENSKAIEKEIHESLIRINEEGRVLKKERDKLVTRADPQVFRLYERLLRNKRDRVVVAVQNRCCSGCHIMLTAQHENLVRKGERLVFCEHCSRIHYWTESRALEDTTVATKKRRRKSATV